MNKISVIIPVYNVELYLRRCLNSIVNQTYTNLEIILIDDGSTDSSPLICDEYAEKDNRIIVIHKSNEGVSAARNDGIDLATGEYLTFVDSDDYIDYEMIERLISNVQRFNADLSISGFTETCDDETKIEKSDDVRCMDKMEALKHLYIDSDIGFVTLWGKLIKKDLFNDIRLPVGVKCAEDNYITYKLLYKCTKIAYEKSKMYMYFQRSNSETKTFDESSAEDFKAFSVQMDFWKKENKPEFYRMCFVRCFKRLMLTLDCAENAETKSEDFYIAMQREYESAIKAHISYVKIGPLEKKMYLTNWLNGKRNLFPFYYIRIKDFLRNHRFLKNYSLK